MGGLPSIVNPILSGAILAGQQTTAYKPPQWRKVPAMVQVTTQPSQSNFSTPAGATGLGATSTQGLGSTQGGTLQVAGNTSFTYVFDAVLALEHEQRLVKTVHPVQTGSEISSHAYLMPARLTLDIGMSDAMFAYTAQGVDAFTGNSSRSVSAYQTMVQWQAQRALLTITTRLRTYQNMLVAGLGPREDYRTITGLRCRFELEEIFLAQIGSSQNSARPNLTGNTSQSTVNPVPVSNTTVNQFSVISTFNKLQDIPALVNVPGAGSFSSVNVSNLLGFF